ncbi:MAG: flagellar biosynthesis protein FlhF [Lachnospiraceae bacterium]
MIVKKFEGRSETEAIMKAKEELGSQAVVLSVKTIKQRGIMKLFKKDMVEITAALEEKDFVQEINERRPTADGGRTHIDLVASDEVKTGTKATAKTGPSDKLEQKLDDISELLKNQINQKEHEMPKSGVAEKHPEDKETGEKESATDLRQENMNNNIKTLRLVYNKMIDNEVDEKYANALVNEIENSLKKESNIDSILAGIYQKIILKLGEPSIIQLEDKKKVVFFVGPTGVGKTTTIAKIASKFKLNEHKKVAFVTSDTYRIAAVEQLNTYANILDVPVRVVYTEEEMKKALDEFKEYDLVLVDTAGRSHKNDEQRNAVVDLYKSIQNGENDFECECYLVLSVTTKYRDLISIAKAYENLGKYKLLFTKLDETGTLGNILNIKLMTGADLSYTTAGQNVPDDIETINVQKLAKHLLGGSV